MLNSFKIAQQYMPGGVNSPVRAFSNVDESPIFIARAQGAYIFDTHQQAYIDYVGSWGPMILGHAYPAVISAVQKVIQDGLSFGAPTEIETKLAALICTLMPSIQMIRMVNSGTEAVMSAIRLARGFTGKNKIIKFNGCYHGHVDSLLVKAGSGNLTFGQPDSLGVPESFTKHTLVAEYNDIASVEKLFQQYPHDIAGLIIEPVAGNMNCVLPHENFLNQLKILCDHYQSLLIFDEVMTGFRVGLGGAQEKYGIKPDMTILGKIIGGGMPVGAFGGRKDIMEKLSPLGGVYQAGTLSGNPIAMTAGFVTLTQLVDNDFYPDLEKNTAYLLQQLKYLADKNHIPFQTQHAGSLFGLFFTDTVQVEAIRDLEQVNACHKNNFKRFFSGMLKRQIYFAPSAFEAGFLSIMHHEKEIQKTLNAAENVFNMLSK